MNPQLSEALKSAALFGAVIRPLLVMTILVGLWYALARTKLSAQQRLLGWSTVAAVLILWLSLVWTLALRGVMVPPAGVSQAMPAGLIFAPTIILVISALTLLTRSETITAAVDAAPLWWLVAYQVYRVAGFVFVQLWSRGFLPGYFALPAGIGDTLTGVFAMVGVVVLWRNLPWARTLAYAVNIFGIADLVNAISMGVISTLEPATAGVSPLLMYPLVIVASFGVPLAFIVHCLSIWQLRRRGRLFSSHDLVEEERVMRMTA
jgi:hypothetical protein